MGFVTTKWVDLESGAEFEYEPITNGTINDGDMMFFYRRSKIRIKIKNKIDGTDKWMIVRYRMRHNKKFNDTNKIPVESFQRWFKNHRKWLRDPLSQDDKDLANWIRENWTP